MRRELGNDVQECALGGPLADVETQLLSLYDGSGHGGRGDKYI